jgi:hypothetical protein
MNFVKGQALALQTLSGDVDQPAEGRDTVDFSA